MKKHSIVSNYIYLHKPLFKEEKVYIAGRYLKVLLSVVVPLIGTMLSAFIVWLLGVENNIFSIAGGIIAVFLGYALVSFAKVFVIEANNLHIIPIRCRRFLLPIMKKDMIIPLEKFEDPDMATEIQKADNACASNMWGIEGFFRYLDMVASGIIGLIVYLFIMGTVNPLVMLLLTVLAVMSATFNYLPVRYRKKIRDKLAKNEVTMDYIDGRIAGNTAAGKDIRAYGLTDYIIGEYDKAVKSERKYYRNLHAFFAAGSIVDISISALRDLVCYIYLISCLKNGMSIAEFVFYLGIIGGLSGWLNELTSNITRLLARNDEVSCYRNYMEAEEGKRADILPEKGFDNIDIVFEHVFYRYKGADRNVLDDVSFHIAPGEHMALVGLNGAGKSTIVKLLSGLYMPTEGNIYVNGINTRDIDLKEYYSHEAAVFQEPFISSYTIAENVALSLDYDEKNVIDALERAGLKEKLDGLSNGINTYLGKDIDDSGISLSGGETQKLLLARALYRNPSLMLLDEPTAALDALAEKEIYEIYNTVLSDVTSLFISHRLASTRFCKNIILLENGKIVEEGDHEALMEKNGRYFELFKVQSKYYEEEGKGNVA